MRFSITDPIVKGICRYTDVVVAAEESVSVSDSGTKVGPSASSMLTPSHQKTFSKDVIPDYRLYTLKHQYNSQHSHGFCLQVNSNNKLNMHSTEGLVSCMWPWAVEERATNYDKRNHPQLQCNVALPWDHDSEQTIPYLF